MKRCLMALAAAASFAAVPANAQQYGCGQPWMMQQGGSESSPMGNGYGPGAMMQGWGANGMMGNPGGAIGRIGGNMGGNMMGRMMDAPGRGRFAIIDADEDGVVTAEEAASAADEVFTAMDSDDDGALTREEYLAVRMGTGEGWNAQRQAARQAAKEARFAEMDTDRNGTVSRAEFMDGARAHFEAADSDKDERVTPWEFRRQTWN